MLSRNAHKRNFKLRIKVFHFNYETPNKTINSIKSLIYMYMCDVYIQESIIRIKDAGRHLTMCMY